MTTMQFSVSRVQCFQTCPHQFKMRYVDGLKTYPDYDDPANALYLGTALHTGIEQDVDAGVRSYYDSYPIITDLHVNEAMKLELLIPKAKAMIPEGEYEVLVENEVFKGFIDLLVDKGNGHYDIYDFKYSNNVEKYMQSFQLHVYKQAVESFLGGHVDRLFYLFVPKTAIRQKKTEDLMQFRKRLTAQLEGMTPELVEVPADEAMFQTFLDGTKDIENAREYPKRECRLCDWCEYKDFCKGVSDLAIDWDNSPFVDWADYKERSEYGRQA